MDIQYPLLAVGSVLLVVVIAGLNWSLPQMGWLPATRQQRALRTALLVAFGFAAGVLILVLASNKLLGLFLPQDSCLAWMPSGRGCVLRSHTAIQVAAGLLGVIVVIGRGWDSDRHLAPDHTWAIPLVILVSASALAGVLLAALDCQRANFFCTASDGIPGCGIPLLMFFGAVGYVFLAGRDRD